jgi:hypothetical protein
MIRPDEAMGQLYPRPPAAPAAAADAGAGAELDVSARLALVVDRLGIVARQLAAQREAARLSWEQCHPIDIPPWQSPGAGTIDPLDIWGPRQNFAWHVLLLPAVLGQAGTMMSLYRDAPVPTNLVFQSTVSGLFEPRRLILVPGRRLVWTSAGDGLTVSTGIAVEIALDALPAYLMGP